MGAVYIILEICVGYAYDAALSFYLKIIQCIKNFDGITIICGFSYVLGLGTEEFGLVITCKVERI